MGSLEGRISRLEGLIPEPEDEGAELRRAVMVNILNEIGHLSACRARNSYRGGTPMTPIQPTDPAGEALGYPYTWGELTTFAIRRVFERLEEEGMISGEAVEQVIDAWVDRFKEKFAHSGRDWDDIDAEGPPEPTRPWR